MYLCGDTVCYRFWFYCTNRKCIICLVTSNYGILIAYCVFTALVLVHSSVRKFVMNRHLSRHRLGTWQQRRWTPSRYSSLRPRKLFSDTPVFPHGKKSIELHPVSLDLWRYRIFQCMMCPRGLTSGLWMLLKHRSQDCYCVVPS